MAIVQISKIQQRAGNLVDLPQLDNGEFGWATDTNRLFIGKTGNIYSDENIEVLTSYSSISFSQIEGSDGGNFNITTPQNGQILTYVSSTDTWENYSGNISQFGGTTKLQLGQVSNISMTGGAIGYVLQTDGVGNLSWTPKNTLYTTIKGLTNNVTGNIVTMTVPNTTPYTNGQSITISGGTISNSGANSNINGQTFYVKLNGDYATSGNVILYSDSGLLTTANGAGLVSYTANSGIATAALGGSGTSTIGGSNTSVQFNDQNVSNGVAGFTFDKTTTTLTVSTGNIVTGNVNAVSTVTAPRLISNIVTGTSPLTVTSTTRVANLNVSYANVSDYTVVTLQSTGIFYPLLANSTSGNVPPSSNASLSFNAATGALSATLFTGTLTTAAQPNITSVGTLTSLGVTGNTTSGNFLGRLANGNSNVNITASNGNVTVSVTGTANVVVVANTGIVITGNANISGTANVVGNANVGNLGTARVLASANVTAPQLISNVATGTSPLVVTSTTQVANLSSATSGAVQTNTSTSSTVYLSGVTSSANGFSALNIVSGISANMANNAISATTFVGNLSGQVTTATQGNITSLGTLTSLDVTGNTTSGNFATAGNITASFLVSNVATGTAPLTVSSTTQVANLNAATAGTADSATTAGTVTTAAQPNITSVGTLTSLTVSGNLNGNTIVGSNGAGGLKITGAVGIAGDLELGGAIDILGGNGNASGNTVGGPVQIVGGSSSSTGTGGYAALIGGTSTGLGAAVRASGGTGGGTGGNLTMFAGTGVGVNTAGSVVVISGGKGTGSGVPGNVAIQVASAIASGSTTQSWANVVVVTSTGAIITGTASASANITTPQFISNIATGTAPLVVTSTTQVANLNAATAGTVRTAAQPNITSVGTLTSLGVTGTTTSGNFATAGNITASFLVSNIADGTAPLTVTSTTQVANLNAATAGTVRTAAQPNITSVGTLTSLDVTGNTTSGNFVGQFANGNSNVNIPAIYGNVTVSVTGTANVVVITNTGMNVAGTANISGNANVLNLGTTQAFATANITAPQFISNVADGTPPFVVASSTRVLNLRSSTAITVVNAAQPNITSTGTLTSLTVSGNIVSSNIVGSSSLLITGAIGIAGDFEIGGTIGITGGNGNATGATIGGPVQISGGFASPTGIGGYAELTGGTSTGLGAAVRAYGGGGTTGGGAGGNLIMNAGTGVGTNINGGVFVISGGKGTGSGVPGNVTIQVASAIASGATPQTLANIVVVTSAGASITGALTVPSITTGANTTAGNITGNWTLTAGSKLQATYADLAEYYVADIKYEPGTVLEFGGQQEVTIAEDGTSRIAGVVSTNPAYVMNSLCKGQYIVALALQGRVPCKVRGTIRKGDMLVSGGGGFARPSTSPAMGTVIGKALENFEGEGVIEVAVGRL